MTEFEAVKFWDQFTTGGLYVYCGKCRSSTRHIIAKAEAKSCEAFCNDCGTKTHLEHTESSWDVVQTMGSQPLNEAQIRLNKKTADQAKQVYHVGQGLAGWVK